MGNQSPLADRVRPQKLKDFFGQESLIGKGSFLREALQQGKLPSLILWGPPGTGKTTLARIISRKIKAEFFQLSAVASGKKDLLEIIKKAENNRRFNGQSILFIDEIHRWNKAQQDALLPYLENGTLILIGATTENPSFEVNAALLSRSKVLVFKRLQKRDIKKILARALKLFQRGEIVKREIQVTEEAFNLIAHFSNGDARTALNALEICLNSNQKMIGVEVVKRAFQQQVIFYDKDGEEHYNIISALHKSMRGGDAHAALYWLARMLEGGEDPVYIARRLVRFASEDVGLADNHALVLANAVFDACQKLGYPECNVHLAQAVIYLSKTKKSILAYEAYRKAKRDVKNFGNLPVPLHLRNAPTQLMKDLNYGKSYKYTPKENSTDQEYFPKELKRRKYFNSALN